MFARNRLSTDLTSSDSFGSNVAEHVELRVVGVGLVQVVLVVTGPEEGLAALDLLDAVGVDAAVVQDGVLLVAEVVADRADDVDVGEEARGQREVHGGAAEHPLALAEGRLDRVEGDRSDYSQAHEADEPTCSCAFVDTARHESKLIPGPRRRRRARSAGAPPPAPPRSFKLGTGSHPDVAVDSDRHRPHRRATPAPSDDDSRYCQVPRGQDRVRGRPDADAARRGDRPLDLRLPARRPNRVVIVTHRCCTPDATLAYESIDNGGRLRRAGDDRQPGRRGRACSAPATRSPASTPAAATSACRSAGPQATQQAILHAGFTRPDRQLDRAARTARGRSRCRPTATTRRSACTSGAGDPNDAGTWDGPTPITPAGRRAAPGLGAPGHGDDLPHVGAGRAARAQVRRQRVRPGRRRCRPATRSRPT